MSTGRAKEQTKKSPATSGKPSLKKAAETKKATERKADTIAAILIDSLKASAAEANAGRKEIAAKARNGASSGA